MQLDIKTIQAEGRPRDLELGFDLPGFVGDRDEPLLAGQARLHGVVTPGRTGAELEATVEATLRLACSRCLESFDLPVCQRFSLDLVLAAPAETEGEQEIRSRDTTLFHAEGGKADIRAIVTEQLYLGLPLKTLCSPECRGLCTTCGANRNRIECDCDREELDPRLAPLLEFKKRREEGG